MKKTKILILSAILALTFSGCSGKKANKYNDYSFKGAMDEVEKYAVLAKAQATLHDIVSLDVNSNFKYSANRHETSAQVTLSETFYSNYGLKFEEKEKVTETNDGITIVDEVTRKGLSFYEPTTKLGISRIEDSKDGISFDVLELTEGKEEASFGFYMIEEIYTQLVSFIDDETASGFKNKKTYTFIKSNIQETRLPVDLGNETKEQVTILRQQQVLEINDKYEIKSLTTFSDMQTNRDPGTAEWYKKVTLVQEQTTEYKYKYGTRKQGDYSSVTSALNTGFIFDPNLTVLGYGFNKPGDEWVPAAHGNLYRVSSKTTYETEKIVHFKGYYRFNTYYGDERYGMELRVTATSIASLNDEEPIAFAKDIDVSTTWATTFSDETSTRYILDADYDYGSTLYVEFDLVYANDAQGAKIENANITVMH